MRQTARHPALVWGVLLAGPCLGLLGSGAGCRRTPEQRLVDELAGSLPREAAPSGVVRTFDLVAAPARVPVGDGRMLDVWAYNGTVPGPTFRVRLGETLRVRFKNELPQPTTVHWHGVRVPNAMDGVPGLTQPPVPPGGTFTYEFAPKDAGTFWFHPHVRSSEQVERGLYGVLIVEDREPPPYTRDVVWVLDDWLLGEDGQIFPEFNTPHDLAHDGRWGNLVTVNGRTDTILPARSGERLRLRLVNSANGRVFAPELVPADARVEAQVIAVDGNYLRAPVPLAGFEIAPGNRLDLDVRVQAGASVRIALVDRFYARAPNHLADIEVDGVTERPAAPFASPAHAVVPRWREALSWVPSQEFRLDARRGGRYGIEWTINDQAFEGHEVDATGGAPAGHVHASSHSPAMTLRKGRFHKLRFANLSYRLHPIHTHGMFFRLLARNGQPVDEPFFRDTVLIHARETVDLGVVPLDEGDWMLHCHILEHAEAGMMTTLRVSP